MQLLYPQLPISGGVLNRSEWHSIKEQDSQTLDSAGEVSIVCWSKWVTVYIGHTIYIYTAGIEIVQETCDPSDMVLAEL